MGTASDQSIAFIGLGSNLGDRISNLRAAITAIEHLGDSMETSSVYESEPFGVNEDQPLYLNMVLALRTPLKPMQLLGNLLEIERANGRVRNRPKQSRTLDLDILMLDRITLNLADLVIPHPRMHERSFVMFPLAEIAPHVVHPTLNLTVAEIADGLPSQAIRRLGALSSLTQLRDR